MEDGDKRGINKCFGEGMILDGSVALLHLLLPKACGEVDDDRKRIIVKSLHSINAIPCRIKPMLYYSRVGIKKNYPSSLDPISLSTLHEKAMVSSARTITHCPCSSSLHHPLLSPSRKPSIYPQQCTPSRPLR